MSIKSSSGSTIFCKNHYKTWTIFEAQITRVAVTMVNVAYSDFMKMNKITNMLISCTRDTFPHDPNHARSTIHSVVAVPCTLLQNLLVSLTRQWFPYYCVFAACTNVLLAHAWHIFLIIAHFYIKITNEKTCFRNEPDTDLAFARAMAVFKMLLWPNTFCKKVTATRRFRHDCLENSCETKANAYYLLLFWNAIWLYLSFAHRKWPRLCWFIDKRKSKPLATVAFCHPSQPLPA